MPVHWDKVLNGSVGGDSLEFISVQSRKTPLEQGPALERERGFGCRGLPLGIKW